MNAWIKEKLHRVFLFLPKAKWIYILCKRYVDDYNGDNNHFIKTNGELRILKKNLPQCQMIFDVGANIGQWTHLALKINPNLTIHCFEPAQAAYQKLSSQPIPENVTCNHFGLSSKNGQETLYLFDEESELNSIYQRQGLEASGLATPQRTQAIQLKTLETYCEEKNISQIDFLKVDVEGHELEVFKGMSSFLKKGQVKMIQFEYGGTSLDAKIFLKTFFDLFKDLDYDFYKIYSNKVKLISQYDQKLDNFQYQNWLLIHKDSSFSP